VAGMNKQVLTNLDTMISSIEKDAKTDQDQQIRHADAG